MTIQPTPTPPASAGSRRLSAYVSRRTALVNEALNRIAERSWSGSPSILRRSLRHALFPGGKRLRPLLVLASAEICGGRPADALPAAAAAELIHTASLVHDDLPSMDDAAFRRGRPTNFRLFGEAVAILTGDALLTSAFEALASVREKAGSPGRIVEVVRLFSSCAGPAGMTAGQVLDVLSARPPSSPRPTAGRARSLLRFIHRRKTALLIEACLESGAVMARSSRKERAALRIYGEGLGLAFQVADDLHDASEDRSKLTHPAVFGRSRSLRAARDAAARARRALLPFGPRAWMLHAVAEEIANQAG